MPDRIHGQEDQMSNLECRIILNFELLNLDNLKTNNSILP